MTPFNTGAPYGCENTVARSVTILATDLESYITATFLNLELFSCHLVYSVVEVLMMKQKKWNFKDFVL